MHNGPRPIYWAVLLNKDSSELLIKSFPPRHPKCYAENMPIVFKPTNEQNNRFFERIGEEVSLDVIGHIEDYRGEAVLVNGFETEDNRRPHITISCDYDVKPYYSNTLIQLRSPKNIWPFTIHGVIAAYTQNGWQTKL